MLSGEFDALFGTTIANCYDVARNKKLVGENVTSDAEGSSVPASLNPLPTIYEPDAPNDQRMITLCNKRPFVCIRGLVKMAGIDPDLFTTTRLRTTHGKCKLICDEFENGPGNLKLLRRCNTSIWMHSKYQYEYEVGKSKSTKFAYTHFESSTQNSEWHAQLSEINKLPDMLRVAGPNDMLSSVDYWIGGVNTPQLYLKVGGNRTGVHQEDLNALSVNINFGPSTVTWYFVEQSFQKAMRRFADERNINFDGRAWFPNVEDLRGNEIPVSVLQQKAGDIVYTNYGTLHWVESVGRCNAIAWNIMPRTCKQFAIAIERLQFNLDHHLMQNIPFVQIIWHEAARRTIKSWMIPTLRTSHCRLMAMKRFLSDNNICTERYVRAENEPCQFCSVCQDEIFNYIFVSRSRRQKSFCFACVNDFSVVDCLEERSLDELGKIVDAVDVKMDVLNLHEEIKKMGVQIFKLTF